jgi:hypothetical protein
MQPKKMQFGIAKRPSNKSGRGHAKRRAIQGGRGSILKCGVSGVIVPVLNFEIEFCSTPLHHWKYPAGHS